MTEKYTQAQVDLMRRTYAPKATDDEFALFLQAVERTGLDPFNRQIYAIARYDKKAGREVLSVQTSIDGFRLVAERTGKYAGQQGPFWCGPDGQWVDVWVAREPPAAARVAALRTDFSEPCWGVARFDGYAQKTRDGKPSRFWAQMPDLMIAKVAEALALRRAFPQELSGLYTSDEMAQADTGGAPAEPPPAATPEQEQPPARTGRWVQGDDLAYAWDGEGEPDEAAYRELYAELARAMQPRNWTPDEAVAAHRLAEANRKVIGTLPDGGRKKIEEYWASLPDPETGEVEAAA